MDEYLLNDLLECSVCLERLDTSSKVLPCQHTFCKKCLEEILSTKHELRCPECRVLVTTSIDELPPNVLLMRILEGMRHAGNEPKKKQQSPEQKPLFAYNPKPIVLNVPAAVDTTPLRPSPASKPVYEYTARALFDYKSIEQGDLCFNKGDIITMKSKIDTHWAQGECQGRTGIFPLTFVQVMTPMPPNFALCRALYDFKMNNDEVEGCLSFRKDEVLSVLRRVDENWIEGRFRNRVGIFPLAFVELNDMARAVIKFSSNEQPGPSRLAPPTPTSEESTPLIPTQTQNLILSPTPEITRPTPGPMTANRHQPTETSSSSTTTPNSSGTSNTSSTSSSTGPSSPASPQQLNPFIRQQTILLPTSHITTQARDKRHSFTAIVNQTPAPPTNRHSAEILSSTENRKEENVLNASGDGASAPSSSNAEAINGSESGQLTRQGSQRHKRSASDFSPVTLPAAYVALYPYKPMKADELELKKGGVYLVTERCQDGWFKGTSNRTQKSGVFPGNYVTLAKPAQNTHSRVVSSSPRDMSLSTPIATKPKSLRQPFQSTLAPPELPPRASSPAPAPRPARHPWPYSSPPAAETETAVDLPAPAVPNKSEHVQRLHATHTSHISPPPNVTIAQSATPVKSAEKVKEKKERSGLMKRLAAMKRSKSPTVPAYSMDNPVFEDSSLTTATTSTVHAAHSRSGSCPSQLMQLPVGTASNHHHRPMSTSLSARATKQKERPSVAAAQFVHALSRVADGSQPLPVSHRKSSSLDAGDPRNPKHIVPSVRERFRCIVPYPPNSEYELELRVGDIIYVHRKRDDGWYKGTQQRTGRTGLFPASFVETC